MKIFGKEINAKTTKKPVEPEIQVMMLGARRVGKTSMLASMYNSFSTVTSGTNLIMSKKGGLVINESLECMKSLFKTEHLLYEQTDNISDFTQTQGFDKIDFLLKIAGKKEISRVIRFVDCSGEWISSKTNEEEVGDELEKSDVVIIAIDTVLLMEENGKYNSQNAVQSVTEFIKNNMNPDGIVNNKKMVLFVPTKCEKYFHQNNDPNSIFYGKRMDMINSKIQEEYAELFSFLTCPNCKNCFTVAIMPVITLGGIEFDEFAPADPNRKDILTGEMKYRYCEPNRFEPQFCDRPLIYSLLFVQQKMYNNYYQKAYRASTGKRKLSATVVEWFKDKRNVPNDTDYVNELNKLKEKVSYDKHPYAGFTILQDPDSIEMKREIKQEG